jgi:hypothetical protein
MPQQANDVQRRNCHGCTLCCKLLSVEELDKAPLTWCAMCDPKAGCKTYEHRPTECRNFYCGYLLDTSLDERWKPSSCKMVVSFEEHANATVIYADAAYPGAWRRDPFYAQIRRWALEAAHKGGQLVVWQGDNKIVVSADGQAHLVLTPDDTPAD